MRLGLLFGVFLGRSLHSFICTRVLGACPGVWSGGVLMRCDISITVGNGGLVKKEIRSGSNGFKVHSFKTLPNYWYRVRCPLESMPERNLLNNSFYSLNNWDSGLDHLLFIYRYSMMCFHYFYLSFWQWRDASLPPHLLDDLVDLLR